MLPFPSKDKKKTKCIIQGARHGLSEHNTYQIDTKQLQDQILSFKIKALGIEIKIYCKNL